MSDTPTMTDIRRGHRKYLKPFYDKAIEKALNAAQRRHKESPPLTDEEIRHIKHIARSEVRARADILSLRAWAAKNDLTFAIENGDRNASQKKVKRNRKKWSDGRKWRTNAQRKNKKPQSTSKSQLQEMLENN